MKKITEYDNIFHYFKGSTPDRDHGLQFENNTTKALVNVLQHSPSFLTTGLLQLANENFHQDVHKPYTYALQVGTKLDAPSKEAWVLGIAEERIVSQYGSNKRTYSIPDAVIVSSDVAVLIETKIGADSKLQLEQLQYHEQKFNSEQKHIKPASLLTWKRIRTYFKSAAQQFHPDSKTAFLIEQFDGFCEINGLGGTTHEHHFLNLPFVMRTIAREVDSYIWNTYKDAFEPPNTKRGIAYRRKGRRAGFGKLCTDRNCLILRYGPSGSQKGLEMQVEVDRILGVPFVRVGDDLTRYTHETYLDYRYIQKMNDIFPLIQKAYEETL
ncbi:hypothetical protein IKQ_06025 [Bacillus cereus VDM053]|nr:hypothetical protein IKQ_06025 [Bacillus cereus VDM053]